MTSSDLEAAVKAMEENDLYYIEKKEILRLIKAHLDREKAERAELANRLNKVRIELCINHQANKKTSTGKNDCKEGDWHWNADLSQIISKLEADSGAHQPERDTK